MQLGEFMADKTRSEMTPKGTWPEWMSLKSVASYADVSERTLREWMHSPDNPLPYSQRGGKILIKRVQFDEWMNRQTVQATRINVDSIVNEICSAVRK